MLTQANLREILEYFPDTGIFRWKVSRPPRAVAGAIAGFENGSGYIKISIGGKRYYAHRLAFLWMSGSAPSEIDHINHCRSDNRWANLRAADRSSNTSNVAGRSGIRQRYGRWYARFCHTHLGSFKTKEEAISARRHAELRAAGLDPNESRTAIPLVLPPKREHKSFVYRGKTLSEWSRITGIPQPTLHWRIHIRGLSPKEALGI